MRRLPIAIAIALPLLTFGMDSYLDMLPVEMIPSEEVTVEDEDPSIIRWGILGTADVAQVELIPALMMNEHSSIAAVASRTVTKAKKVAQRYGIVKTYSSYRELLDDPAIDAVYIALPNHLHKKWTILAAQAGKHVLCEKPLATDVAECQVMMEACQKANVKLMEALKYRYHPLIDKAQELLHAETIGTPLLLRASIGVPLAPEEDADNFRWSARQGGGAMLDLGCYCVHAARLLFNDEPLSVMATKVEAPLHPGVDAQLHAILTFSDNRTAIIDCSFLTDEHQEIELIGSEGRLVFRNPFFEGSYGPSALEWQCGDSCGTVECSDADLFSLEVEHFVTCIRDDVSPATDGHDSVLNMKVLEALYRSAKSGKAVKLNTSAIL